MSTKRILDEIALYDRQIRLWGLKAQEKIRSAHILLITMRALGNEIAKNLVLAGIGQITIVDHEAVTPVDLGAQFLISAEDGHIGMNRAEASSTQLRRLNPRVKVNVETDDIRTKAAGYFQPFDIVIATDLDSYTLNIINTATRLNNRPFYAAGSHGMYGFIFADLIEHDFVVEREVSNVTTKLGPETRTRSVIAATLKKGNPKIELVTKRELYSTWFLASDAPLPQDIMSSPRRRRAVLPALSCLRALWEFTQEHNGRNPSDQSHDDITAFTQLAVKQHASLGLPSDTLKSDFLRSFMQCVGTEFAATTALLGGQLAQDVINVLGQNQKPIQNFLVFDGEEMAAEMYQLHYQGQLGAKLLEAAPQVAGVNGNGIPPVPAHVEVIDLD